MAYLRSNASNVCFPNLSNVCFPNLWLPNTFQTTSKLLPKGLKDKVTVSLLRRGLQRHQNSENAQFRTREKSYLLILTKVIPKPTQKIFKQFFCVSFLRMDYVVLANGWIAAKGYCDVLLHWGRKAVWCNRSLKVSVGTKSNYLRYLRYCSETRSETSRSGLIFKHCYPKC